MSPSGSLNGRSTSGIWRRIAASTIGPDPNDSTVAEVMNPTSCCQLGNGRNTIRPTKNVTIRLTSGTPRCVVRPEAFGALPFLAIAYVMRPVTVV